MSAFHDLRNEALSGYRDLRDFTPPLPPVCAKQAEWEDRTRAEDAAERDGRIAAQVEQERAEMRARCTVDWPREFGDLLAHINRVRVLRRQNGFRDPLFDEGRELIHRLFEQICGGEPVAQSPEAERTAA